MSAIKENKAEREAAGQDGDAAKQEASNTDGARPDLSTPEHREAVHAAGAHR
jgi:hypothetical protein